MSARMDSRFLQLEFSCRLDDFASNIIFMNFYYKNKFSQNLTMNARGIKHSYYIITY